MNLNSLLKDTAADLLDAGAKTKKMALDKIDNVIQDSKMSPEEKWAKHKEEMCAKNPNNIHIWLQTNYERSTALFNYHDKQTYRFFSSNEQEIYHADSKYDNKLQRIVLKNSRGETIGEIKEKHFALRNPLHKGAYPADFDLNYRGLQLGKIQDKNTITKSWLEATHNGWKINHNFFRTATTITSSDERLLAEIHSKLFGNMYFIDIYDKENAQLILLFVLAAFAYDLSVARKQNRESMASE